MPFNHRVALALAPVISVCVLAGQAPQQAESLLAITDVTLIDGTGTAARSHMTVTMSDGRITAVVRSDTFQPPPGARVINGTGRFAMPGLWNMHVHSVGYEQASKAFPDVLAAGIVGIRDLGAPVDDVLRLRTETNHGRLRGPHMLVAGPLLARGIPPRMAGTTMLSMVGSAEQAFDAVASLKKRGVDFIKVDGSLTRAAYFAVAAAAKRENLFFDGHIPPAISANEASNAGQRSIEHLGGPHHAVLIACSTRESELQAEAAAIFERQADAVFRSETPDSAHLRAAFTKRVFDTFSDAKAAALFDRFRKNNTWHVPTLVTLRSLWRSQGLAPEDIAEGARIQQKQLDVVARMWRSGVKIMAGTDGPLPQAGPALHDELALLVKAGLSPMDALQAATRNPAEFMGRLGEAGTIEPGKVADVVVLDANPLVDIENARRVTATILAGTLVPTARPVDIY
jgi:imidazolonepropionase-like amidohydrolase